MTTEKVLDILGQEVVIGSTIAVSYVEYRSAVLRIGMVTEFGTRNEPWYDRDSGKHHDKTPIIKLKWQQSSGWSGMPNSYVPVHSKRFVVVDNI